MIKNRADRRLTRDNLNVLFADISRILLAEIVTEVLGYRDSCLQSDYHFFTKLEEFLSEKHFSNDEEVNRRLKNGSNRWS